MNHQQIIAKLSHHSQKYHSLHFLKTKVYGLVVK